MNYSDNNHGLVAFAFLAGIGFLLLAVLVWNWYRAGVQADIYKRQGITMSQWEVFIGTTPAERVMQIREAK